MNSELLKLSILSPERRLAEKISVQEVILPTSEGQVQVLAGHAPMIGVLEAGIFQYRAPDKEPVIGVISSGFFEIRGDEISVLSETLELKSEIDVDRAKKAQQEAEKTLQDANLDEHHFKEYQLRLERALIRQQAASQTHEH